MEINPIYKNKKVLKQIKVVLNKEGSLQLENILTPKSFKDLLNKVKKLKYKKEKTITHSYAKAKFSLQALKQFTSSFTAFKLSHKDYELTHSQKKTEYILELQDWPNDVGGINIYKDDKGNYIKIKPKANTLTLIKKKKWQPFIQYVNYKAKGQRLFLKA